MEKLKHLTPEIIKDPAFRKSLRQNAKKVLREYGWQGLDDVEVVVLTNDKTHIYFTVPDKRRELTAEVIDQVQAAGVEVGHTIGTVGSVSTGATASSGFSCFGTLSSAACIGTAGTAKVA